MCLLKGGNLNYYESINAFVKIKLRKEYCNKSNYYLILMTFVTYTYKKKLTFLT